ncbi:MAG: hypothetical protein NXI16_04130 [Alphaproteobacteria bacterium]|nr:hypothetical protein [Alphaproteobacteria bacterium]
MSAPKFSAQLSMNDVSAINALAKSAIHQVGASAASVHLTVSGTRSAVLQLMDQLKDQNAEMSAVIALRGDRPAKG